MEQKQLDLLDVLARAQKELKHEQKRLHNQQVDKVEADKCFWYQQIADTILAAPHLFPRGTTETIVENVHTQQQEPVTLNQKLNANENAQLLYKKARKGKRGIEVIRQLSQVTQQRITSIENFIAECRRIIDSLKENQPDEQAVARIVALAGEIGLQLADILRGHHKQEASESLPFRQFIVEGWTILVGKNAVQNDELTQHYTKPWDIWFHVAQHQGSHVVIKCEKNGSPPPVEIIRIAAGFSVWFSKAKHTTYCEVHYTEARFVHKPRKSPAGQVLLNQFKSLRVAPLEPQQLFKSC